MIYSAGSGCVFFQNLMNLDRSERNAPTNLRKSDLATPHLCCRASALPVCLWKRVWSAALCADENKMTTPTATWKIRAFFFTGLDRSHLTNLDRSRFVRFWKRTQPVCTFMHICGLLAAGSFVIRALSQLNVLLPQPGLPLLARCSPFQLHLTTGLRKLMTNQLIIKNL